MAKKIDAWKCKECGKVYFSKEEAEDCEEIHTLYHGLEVARIRKQEGEKFPTEIVVRDKSYPETLALYKLDNSFYKEGI